jgi:hypothetical protein
VRPSAADNQNQLLTEISSRFSSGSVSGMSLMQTPRRQISFEDIVPVQEFLALDWYPTQSDSREVWDRAWNRIQVIAAFYLIYYFFGDNWYRLVFRDIQDANLFQDRRYLRYVKSPRVHPLTQWSLTGRPEFDARVLRLGEALKILGFAENDTNLTVKLDELRSDGFAAANFELKIAFIYARSGFRVKFLKPPKGSKSPDLLVQRDRFETVIECKKRKAVSDSLLPVRIGGVIDRLLDANRQVTAVGNHGIVYIEVEENLDYNSPDIRAYVNKIGSTLPEVPAVSCVILTWEKITYPQPDVVSLSTEAYGITNKNCSCPFPRQIWCNPAALAPRKPTVIVDLPPPMRAP